MGLNLLNLPTGAQTIEVPKLEKDTYLAVIVGIIDLGQQLQTEWDTGKEKTDKFGKPLYANRGVFVFEIPSEKFVSDPFEETDDNGKTTTKTMEFVRRVYKEVSFTTNEKGGLMVILNALDIKDKVYAANGNMDVILGTKCMVSTDFTTGGYVKVIGVSKVAKALLSAAVSLEAETTPYSFTMNAPAMEVWEMFGDNRKAQIMKARDYEGSELQSKLNTIEGSGDEEVDAETQSLLG